MAFEVSPWPLYSLHEVCQPIEMVDPRRKSEQSFRYIDIASVSNETFQIITPKELVGSRAPSRARKRIRAGDVLFATTRPYLRSVTLVPIMYDGEVCSTGFCVLRAGGNVLPEWLFYCVLSDALLSQVVPKMRGANYPAVTDRDVYESKIPVPLVEEQRRIVERIKECLIRIDEIKRLREEARREAEAIFPSSLTAQFAEIKDTCVTTTIGEVTLETRYGTSQKCDTKPHGLAILRIPNVATGDVHRDKLKYRQLTSEERAKLLLQNGDILVVRTNGSPDLVGRCAVVELQDGEEFGFASYLIRIRLDQKKVHPRFLSYFLTSRQGRTAIDEIKRTAAGQYNVNSENLRAITFPLPSIEMQTEIVRRLDQQRSISQQLINEQKELSRSESHLTQSVLSKAFAGEL